MKPFIASSLVGLAILGGTIRANADEKADALLAKGLAALGGAEALTKWPAATWKGEGQFHGAPDGKSLVFTGEWARQAPDKYRAALTMTGTGVRQVRVLDGDKGWLKRDEGDAEPMSPEAVAEEQWQLFANAALTTLLPLKDIDVKLGPGGELKAVRDGRELRLWLDPNSGLPLKGVWKVGDATHEVLLSDYKDVKGMKRAMKVVLHRDGKLLLEMKLSDFEPAAEVEEKTFAKP